MKTIYHFLRLIRLTNLLVIGLTMVVVEMFLLGYKSPNFIPVYQDYSVYDSFMFNVNTSTDQISGFLFLHIKHFILLIFSTLLIAAAGNIINDYFDVKADRINKPNRLIIGKHIKRRWAMVLHWSFNSIGMIIALYVGYELQNIWVPLIAFLSINLLWFYSTYYKRKPLVGNLIVALLIGIVPIYVLLFNMPIIDFEIHLHSKLFIIAKSYLIDVVLLISGIAFLQNLVRELVKDIQDVRGDLKLGAKTFPIKYGIKKTKYLIVSISITTLLLMAFYLIYIFNFDFNTKGATMGNGIDLSTVTSFNFNYFRLFLLLSAILYSSAIIFIILFNKSKTYKTASTLLKIAMLFGLLTPLFL